MPRKPVHKPLDKIEKNKDYTVVFFQVSDQYWKDMWISKLVGKSTSIITPSFLESSKPGAKVFLTEFENIENLGCEQLQG